MRQRVVLVLAAMALALLMAKGVALAVNKVGTDGPDTLRGTNTADNLSGRGGNDILLGLAGKDNLLGGQGKDVVIVGKDLEHFPGGDKNLIGGPGNDYVLAGKGSDNVVGNEGNDLLVEDHLREFSKDRLSGGPGDDLIDVIHEPAARDLVVCGRGFDWVVADRKDVTAPDCEEVAVGFAAAEQLDIPESFFEGLPPQLSRFF
jgi:Ca2+-binding RTX toxin-like protein